MFVFWFNRCVVLGQCVGWLFLQECKKFCDFVVYVVVVDNYVDGVFLQQEFSVLEVFWQFFVNGLFDYMWIGKVDYCFGLGDYYVVYEGEVGGYIVCGWIGQYVDEWQFGQCQFLDYCSGFGYLYE